MLMGGTEVAQSLRAAPAALGEGAEEVGEAGEHEHT